MRLGFLAPSIVEAIIEGLVRCQSAFKTAPRVQWVTL